MSTPVYFSVNNYTEKGYIYMCVVVERCFSLKNTTELHTIQRACLFICHDIEEFHSGSETRSEKADNHRHETTCAKSKTFIDKIGYFPLHLDMKVKSSSLST